ncbi:MAG: OB-fold nucleic acid binding domain-containing protein [Candidatus Wallbacteria bacterium]|nr:OB-fold nucleic acid binding domain-containing protein [Candidatus Wallbacteria bacterium]
MKRSLLILFVLCAFMVSAYNFLTVKQVLESKVNKFVTFQGSLAEMDYTGQFLTIEDETGSIVVDIHSDNIQYYGYDRPGDNVKVWGYVGRGNRGIYVKARKIQVCGHFYYGQ